MRSPCFSTVPMSLSFSRRTARQIRLYEAPALLSSSSSTSLVAYVIPTPFLLAAAATTVSFTLATVPPVRRAVNRLIRRTLIMQRRVGRLVQRQLSRRQWPPIPLLDNNNDHNKRRFSNQTNETNIDIGNTIPLSAFQQQQPSLQETLQSELFLSTPSSHRNMPSSALKDVDSHLDRVRDRAVAQLRNEQLAVSASSSVEPISDVDYAALPPLQRRELLASTFHHRDAAMARKAEVASPLQRRSELQQRVRSRPVKTTVREGTSSKQNFEKAPKSPWWRGRKKKGGEDLATNLAFWQVVESVNGRAAAIGFMLCLAREIAEPGHPSLFEQVIDVVVPLAQSTPPFLVAVCDKLADLLT